MNPQNDHFLFELNYHQLHQPHLPQHKTAEDLIVQPSRLEKIRNNLQSISRLRRIRIQVVFEVAEPCPESP